MNPPFQGPNNVHDGLIIGSHWNILFGFDRVTMEIKLQVGGAHDGGAYVYPAVCQPNRTVHSLPANFTRAIRIDGDKLTEAYLGHGKKKNLFRPGEILFRPGEILIRPGEILIRPGEILIRPGEILICNT